MIDRDPFFSLDQIFPKTENPDSSAELIKAAPRCDFSPGKRAISSLSPYTCAISLWRRSTFGMTLEQIKETRDMPEFFANNIAPLISSVVGLSLDPEQFVIVAPPKRRHPGKENFASRMALMISHRLGIPFIDDFAVCRTRKRIDPEFHINAPLPEQKNIIVVDDILTTGSTLQAMSRLIAGAGRNAIFFAGILNKL